MVVPPSPEISASATLCTSCIVISGSCWTPPRQRSTTYREGSSIDGHFSFSFSHANDSKSRYCCRSTRRSVQNYDEKQFSTSSTNDMDLQSPPRIFLARRRPCKLGVSRCQCYNQFMRDSAEKKQTTRSGLGLLNRTYETDITFDPTQERTQWERFEHYVQHLNRADPDNVRYKVFYIARHGEGVHNVKEASVGRTEWEARRLSFYYISFDLVDQ